MRLVRWTVVFVFLIVLVLPAVLSLGIRYIPNSFQPSLGNTRQIYDDSTAFQSFTAEKDLFSGLGVSIKNPNFANKKDIILEIFEGDKKLLRTVTLNGKSIADGNFVKFYFPPVEGSLGKTYTFVFSAPTATIDDALEVFLVDKKLPDKDPADVSFVSFYRTPTFYSLPLEIYNQWFGKLTSDFPFFVSYLAIILVLLFLAIKPSRSKTS